MDPDRDDPRSGTTPYDQTHDYNDEDHPYCYVFSAEPRALPRDGGFAQSVAGTISHEAGHDLYLDHQPDWLFRDGRRWLVGDGYGEGDAFRTPIMGDNLAPDRVLWW